jgi:DNA-binding NarL/FixJ family response regulator
LQFDLLDSDEQRKKRISDHDNQLSLLPVSNTQERYVGIPELSSYELQIMQLTLSGVQIHEIAQKIFRTEYCVKWRLTNVYWKFNVKNRLQLINKAVKTGLHFVSDAGIPHSFSIGVDMQGHTKEVKK